MLVLNVPKNFLGDVGFVLEVGMLDHLRRSEGFWGVKNARGYRAGNPKP